MSEAWSEGYFTDVGYTYGYFREINPVFLRFCLLLRGFVEPTFGTHSQHCELGFGQGVSVNIHAAANPGHYVATDFNPAHAAHAQRLASASGNGALLFDESFEQLLARSDLPQFDSISLHGIWTWVSRDNHKIIAEFARRHLKPGGVFYVSYNCFPGWAPAYPLRQLFALHDRFGTTPHGAVERVEAALKFSQELLAAQPNYLKLAPHLPERLKKIAEENRHYLAHEYFNREWNCMYFTDVVDALTTAKLDWACSAVPLDAIEAVNLSQDARSFLASVEHPLLREQARDYFVNQQFRKDIYLKGATRLSSGEQKERLLNTRFVLTKLVDQIPLKVIGSAGEAQLQEELYKPFIQALAADAYAPKTLRVVLSHLPEMLWSHLLQILAVLVHLDAMAPCQSEEAQKQVEDQCKALNRHLCERSCYVNEIAYLASPVTGGGFNLTRFQQIFLMARELGKSTPQDWAQFAWQHLDAQGQRLIKDGKTLETPEENLHELNAQAVDLADKLPILKALQLA